VHEQPLRLGIIGAGKLGMTLARVAVEAALEVRLSGSGDVEQLAYMARLLSPGARATTTREVATDADVVVLAVPFHRFRQLAPGLLDGKVVVDAMDYWAPTDGALPDLSASSGTPTPWSKPGSPERGSCAR